MSTENTVSGTIDSVKLKGSQYDVSFRRDDGKHGQCSLSLSQDRVLTNAFNKVRSGAKLEMALDNRGEYPQVVGVKVNGASVMKPAKPGQ